MRGSIKQRSKGSWLIRLDLGDELDPTTGRKKRQQKAHTFRGSKKEAEDKLADLLKEAKDGTSIDPSKLTLADWFPEWLASAKRNLSAGTVGAYQHIIDKHLVSAPFATMPLQKLRSTHIEAYYAASTLSSSTLTVHHAILHQALRKAVKNKLLAINPASDLDDRPKADRNREDARKHCWTAREARLFLEAAQARGPQAGAFYALALDSGARKGELCGLAWPNLDLDAAKMHIVRQLRIPGAEPVFGKPKNGKPRTVSLSAETVDLLRVHRKHQRELMMANRTSYHDLDLVFAKEWSDVQKRGDCLGHPLQMNNLGQREYAQVIKAAEVRPIKFHGLRHTCATLLLQAGTPVHVVSERLGHSKVTMTLEVYAHVLPDMQREAAATLGSLLHAKR